MLRIDIVLLAVIAIFLALKFYLVARINIHWDEFYFLSLAHDYLRGDLTSRLQTFHVHLFSWLTAISGDEVDQIIAGRGVMAILATASAALIYGIARRFLTRAGALFGVFGYVSLTVVVEHGAGFRVDPLATFLVLLALFLILRWPGRRAGMALAGAVMAIAVMLTIKTVFYLAVIGGVIWCLAPTFATRLRLGAGFALPLFLLLALLYLGHIASLTAPETSTAATYLRGAAAKVLIEEGLLPRWEELLHVGVTNILFFLMTIDGAVLAWRRRNVAGPGAAHAGWLPLLLALPLAAPLFYRNAFAYCYVFLLPPAAILVGLSFEKHRRKFGAMSARQARLLTGLFVALQCFILMVGNGRLLMDKVAPQRVVLAAVHAVFPEPVPYIDGYGAVAGFPRLGFFMSSWGLDQYRKAGQAVFADLVARGQPPLLLANSVALYHALLPGIVTAEEWWLLPDDRRFLAENYVQHWDMLFVAGKTLVAPAPGQTIPFDIVLAGDYRLEARGAVMIDGREIAPADVVTLTKGRHGFAAPTSDPAILRWAAALPAPSAAPVGLAAFFGGGAEAR